MAPLIMALVMRDLRIGLDDSAAIPGDLGYESKGPDMTEDKPAVQGSRGGYGWPQWTGKRRRAYEAYCRRNGLDLASDKVNHKYLKEAIKALKAATTLNAKLKAFELAYERADVKAYKSRNKWAALAIDACFAGGGMPAATSCAGFLRNNLSPVGTVALIKVDRPGYAGAIAVIGGVVTAIKYFLPGK